MATGNSLQTRIAELEGLQHRAESIAQINAALSSATCEQDILAAVAALAQQYHVAMSFLGYAETQPDGSVNAAKVVAMQSGDGNPVPLEILPTTDYPLDANPILRVALENAQEPLFVEDIFTDSCAEGGSTREVFRQSGSVATIILWFKANGQWQGVMTFSWTHAQPFDPELRAIFKAIQPVAAAVVANRRLLYTLEQRIAERTAALHESETLSRMIFDKFLDGILIIQDGLIVAANPSLAALTGYSLTELVGRSGFDLISPESQVVAQEHISLQSEERYEMTFVRQDGSRFLAEVQGTDLLYRGQPARMAVIHDITERYQAENALKESETRFRTLMEQSPFSTQIYRPDGSVLSVNQAYCTFWNATPEAAAHVVERYNILQDEQLVTSGLMPFIQAGFAGTFAETPPIWYDPQKTEVASSMHLTAKWVVGYIWPIKDANGVVQQVVLMHQDITDRKQAEAEREQLQQQVIEAQRQALQELSTPIIPLMNGIIVMPLIGAIDTRRSRDIMRSVLAGINRYRAQIAILDITGVPVVDSGVADHLNRTMQAARLKGAQILITGISDAVAETIVDLGIDWGGVETLRDLQTGLLVALRRLGLQFQAADEPKRNGNGG